MFAKLSALKLALENPNLCLILFIGAVLVVVVKEIVTDIIHKKERERRAKEYKAKWGNW